MSYQYKQPRWHYSTDFPEPVAPYQVFNRTRPDHSYMYQNYLLDETSFQTSNSNTGFEVDDEQPNSFPSCPNNIYDVRSTPSAYHNASTPSNVFAGSFTTENPAQSYANDHKYNQLAPRTPEGLGSDYCDRDPTNYGGSMEARGGTFQQQTHSVPDVQNDYRLRSSNEATIEYPQYETNPNLETYYASPTSASWVSISHHPYSSPDSLATAPNSTHMSYGMAMQSTQMANPSASTNLTTTEPIYNYHDQIHTEATPHAQCQPRQNHGRSQVNMVDSICPRNYPSKCPHPDCHEKTKFFTKEKAWRDHNVRTHEKPFRCGVGNCGMIFGTEADVRRHRIPTHHIGLEEARQYSCQIVHCQARRMEFYRSDKYKEHRERWHGPFYCLVQGCRRGPGHGFKDKGALESHSTREHM